MEVKFDVQLDNWIQQEKYANELLSIAKNLAFDNSIELNFYRRPIIRYNSSQIIEQHHSAKLKLKDPVNLELSLGLAKEIEALKIAPARINLSRLSKEWDTEKAEFDSIKEFVNNKIGSYLRTIHPIKEPKDVVLFGLGRIGRLAARMLTEEIGKYQPLRLKAIVCRRNSSDKDILKRASLLRKDSVHGRFSGSIIENFEEKQLLINGNMVQMIESDDLENLDYTKYNIQDALVIDNTGIFRDKAALGKHLESGGVSQVLLTAPGKDDIPNIVYGVNHEEFNVDNQNIWSAASCTTNAIAPVLKLIEDHLGIINGHLETVHSYTNDQNLLDNYHKKYRRGRSAPLNLVITETGAASAAAKVVPSLNGKLTANAVRVPTPNVSLAIMNLNIEKATTAEDLHKMLSTASFEGALVEQIDYSLSNELVSSDIVGNDHASIIDGKACIVSADGKSIVLYVWYDNEYGYTKQTLRLAKYLAKVNRLTYL
ncbi:UNVERIFIED_CONTAM: hypothetical protein GTU68_043511 [Idotea baltica]|nr:hypothetical protein [Idotea baltica]